VLHIELDVEQRKKTKQGDCILSDTKSPRSFVWRKAYSYCVISKDNGEHSNITGKCIVIDISVKRMWRHPDKIAFSNGNTLLKPTYLYGESNRELNDDKVVTMCVYFSYKKSL
jgi:hypothetical protein